MPSLKEVKNRIASVKSTRKITNAMKMVASSKLHHAQKAIEGMRPYEGRLEAIMGRFLSATDGEIETPFSVNRPVKNVAIIAISSNSSLCGAYNANVIKELYRVVKGYQSQGINVEVFPIGKKVAAAAKKIVATNTETDHADALDHPSYKNASAISELFMQKFCDEQIDKVEIISHHFISSSKQQLFTKTFLPINLETDKSAPKEANTGGHSLDYIIEPSPSSIISSLIPASLHMQVFTAILDSLASEHASRVMAMQVATDNADDLIEQLTLTYNKTRQQAITSELLDIAGGSNNSN